eukprot:472546-Hanusia_phi.AAC.1
MPDYSKGVIYTIRCRNDTSLIYVGSTIQPLAKRWGSHKNDCYKSDKSSSNMMLYQKIRETDWDDWYIELYEEYPCDNIQQLHKREGQVIREIATLNKQIAGRTRKQYYTEKKDKILEQKKEYDEKKKETRKQWACENVTCECGSTVSRGGFSTHCKTAKHLRGLHTTPI